MKIEVKEEHFKFMRMSFGKHEGILFKYVPVGYWHWLSQQHWFFTNDRFFWEKTYYQLKENCKVQKQRFSWQKSAAQIAMILEQIK